MKNLLISILFLTFNIVNAQIVNIPDANFKNTLLNTLCVDTDGNYKGDSDADTNNDGEIQVSEALAVERLYVDHKNIESLEGIKSFKNLTNLQCSYNKLSTLDLQGLTKMTWLDSRSNNLTSIILTGLVNMQSFVASTNNLTSIDLNGLTKLNLLWLDYNHLSEIDLSGLVGLESLDLSFNELKSVPIQNTPYLKLLSCKTNLITNLELQFVPKLQFLYCDQNQISTLDLNNVKDLQQLFCATNKLTNLDLTGLANLVKLKCGENKLIMLDVKNQVNLEIFNCAGNELTELDVHNLLKLTEFSCAYNKLTSLYLTGLKNLVSFHCDNNNLNDLNLKDQEKLNDLGIGWNKFTTIDTIISNLKKLTVLDFRDNMVTSLDLEGLFELTNLYSSYNLLTHINLQDQKKLYKLECNYNKLQDLPNLPKELHFLECSGNLFQSLPDLPINLYSFHCGSNKNLVCLPKLPESLNELYINYTNIKCLPNTVSIKSSDVDLKSYPICNINSGCPYYGNISGNIHLDTSATCQIDSLNQGPKIKNIKVNLTKNSFKNKQYFVNYFGDYSFAAELNDTFLVKIDTINNPFEITCPNDKEYKAVITPTDSINGNLNFGLTCKGSADYGVSSISATRFRPNFQTDVFINAGDIAKSFHGIYCGFKQAGTVKIEIFGPVSYVKPGEHALAPNSIANNNKTLIYNIADFGSLMDSSFNIIALTKSPITVADSAVYIKVTVSPDTKDNNPLNDALTMCFPVRNSHDPNAKEVFPNYRVAGDKWVNYTIYFQNTGNDTAYTVVIKDTLSNKLNASSFQFLNASHRVITELENNVVTFTFPRINLVDSLTNESLSHGWVQFKIKTDPSVNVFTEVDNTAHIYFDTNDPIVTNVAYINHLTTSSSELALNKEKLFVYPNPARNSITITLKTSDNYNLTLRNTFGQSVLTKPFNDNSCTVLLDGLPAGIYYVTVKNESGYWVEKVVKE